MSGKHLQITVVEILEILFLISCAVVQFLLQETVMQLMCRSSVWPGQVSMHWSHCRLCFLSCHDLKVGGVWAARRVEKVCEFFTVLGIHTIFAPTVFAPPFPWTKYINMLTCFCAVGMVRTATKTRALVQKTIRATSTLAETTRILKARCRKWTKRNAANSERLRCGIAELRVSVWLAKDGRLFCIDRLSLVICTSRWRSWSSRMSWNLANGPRSTDRAFRSRWSTTGTNCYKRYK